MTRQPPSLNSVTPAGLASLVDEAWRLEPFTPPFTFSAFFSPEDTLLCIRAAEDAMARLRSSRADPSKREPLRVTELTSGSGLVGFFLLRQNEDATLVGLDIDPEATRVAEHNSRLLGVASRSNFVRSDLWSPDTARLLKAEPPDLLVCNPPYVPEPPTTAMQIEAGAGPHGTAHVLRALELTEAVKPDALALSWCSLSDPVEVVRDSERRGYRLQSLYVAAIADGEYSGAVHSYLRELDNTFINEQSESVAAVAPDGSASFAYLLFAGVFFPSSGGVSDAPAAMERLCADFKRDGVQTLASVAAPFAVHCSILNRWDELHLRVLLHGPVSRTEIAR